MSVTDVLMSCVTDVLMPVTDVLMPVTDAPMLCYRCSNVVLQML